MKKGIGIFLLIPIACVALQGNAATNQVSWTGYVVTTKLGEKTTLPNGTVIMVGVQNHASIIDDKTGEQSSQWCTYDLWLDEKGASTFMVGHCTLFLDNGDVLTASIAGTTQDKPVAWAALGGTGKYLGVTGGGTSKMVSARSDGYADTWKVTGTLTTK